MQEWRLRRGTSDGATGYVVWDDRRKWRVVPPSSGVNGGTVATTGTLTAEDRLKFMISPMKGHHVILCAEDSWNRVLYYDGTDIASYVTDAYVGMAKFSIYIPEDKSNGDPWSYTDAVVIRNVWQNKYLSCNSNGDLSFVANYGDAEAWTISIKDYA